MTDPAVVNLLCLLRAGALEKRSAVEMIKNIKKAIVFLLTKKLPHV